MGETDRAGLGAEQHQETAGRPTSEQVRPGFKHVLSHFLWTAVVALPAAAAAAAKGFLCNAAGLHDKPGSL